MPRFFFDIHDGKFIQDEEGIELDGVGAARQQVWNTLPAMVADRHLSGDMACQLRMDVRDEAGRDLFHAALMLVIEPAEGLQATRPVLVHGIGPKGPP